MRAWALGLLAVVAPSWAMMIYVPDEQVPFARLEAALDATLAVRPRDATVHRALGRLHHLAFVGRTETVSLEGRHKQPHTDPAALGSPAEVEPRLPFQPGERATRADAAALEPRVEAVMAALPSDAALIARGWDPPRSRYARAFIRVSDGAPPAIDRDGIRGELYGALYQLGWCEASCADAAAVGHLRSALDALGTAQSLDPHDPLAALGLATLALQATGARVQGDVDLPAAQVRSIGLAAAVGGLHRAWVLARVAFRRAEAHRQDEGEAGRAAWAARQDADAVFGEVARELRRVDLLLAVADVVPAEAFGDVPIQELRAARAGASAGWWALARGWEEDRYGGVITPLVIVPDAAATYADVDDPGRLVTFDLDGDHVTEAWTWVRPGAGLLVWDPDGDGAVHSGRTLIGEASWSLHFPDGYAALGALDVDGDGLVAGDELDGLRLWFDDGDGVSTPSEVVDLAPLGIVGLRTDGRWGDDGVLGHADGVVRADGSTWPSFDWVGARAPVGVAP